MINNYRKSTIFYKIEKEISIKNISNLIYLRSKKWIQTRLSTKNLYFWPFYWQINDSDQDCNIDICNTIKFFTKNRFYITIIYKNKASTSNTLATPNISNKTSFRSSKKNNKKNAKTRLSLKKIASNTSTVNENLP